MKISTISTRRDNYRDVIKICDTYCDVINNCRELLSYNSIRLVW